MLLINNHRYNTEYTPISASSVAFGHRFKLLSFLKRDTVEIANKNIPALKDKKILELINASLTPENFIGQGTEAKVYKIKDSNFVVKIPYDSWYNRDKNFYKSFLTSMDKINHIEAKFDNGITIMKFIEGECLENCKNHQKIAKMPVSAYQNLLKQLCQAQKEDMYFDNVPGNVIANYDKKTLTAIDFMPLYSEFAGIMEFRPLIQMSNTFAYKNDNYKLQVIGKVILAGLRELYPKVKPSLKIENLDFLDVLKFTEKECGNFPGKTSKEYAKLEQLLTEVKNLKRQESRNKSIRTMLQLKIEETEQLISEYFELSKRNS